MKTRLKRVVVEDVPEVIAQPQKRTSPKSLKAVVPTQLKAKPAREASSAESPVSKRGGVRPGAGRPAYLKPGKRKSNSAYVSLTDKEKTDLEAEAENQGMTLSYLIRERLGLPISS